MISVTSTFAATVRSLADANGPYLIDAGSPLTLSGGPNNPATTFAWDFADGSTANGRVVQHSYPRAGVYPIKLTTTVSQPGGVITEEYARVRVRNTPPLVTAPTSLSVDEGTSLDVMVTFTDQGWLDTHKALFTWGDDHPPEWAAISEQHDAPQGQGTVSAAHAWCDSGSFVVTVEVFDENGGVGTVTIPVEVRNVAPTVHAGPDRFAYPCVPITLIAGFRDPGWCDTHTATWDFGDCDPPQPAVVREEHLPPAGTGVALATHTYAHCGTYSVTCVVTDDDGGVGEDTKIIRVVHLHNGGFEDGFHRVDVGDVGNHWSPTGQSVAGSVAAGAGLPIFTGDQIVVHAGQRSQQLSSERRFDGGIVQRVGANPGWEYQVTAWYHIAPGSPARSRLGVDPAGGVDPSAATIAWSDGSTQGDWTQLCVRAPATADAISIHLAATGDDGARLWFDDIVLAPYPCCDEVVTHPDPPPTREQICTDWAAEKEPRHLSPKFDQDGFGFASRDGSDLRIATFGPPPGTGKLLIPARGLLVVLPFPASEVILVVVAASPLSAAASSHGVVVDQRLVTSAPAPQTISLKGQAITEVILDAKKDDLLIKLCAIREVPSASTDQTKEKQWLTTTSASKPGRKSRSPRT